MAFIGNFDGLTVHVNKLQDIRATGVQIYPANDPSLNEPMPAVRIEFDVCKPCHKNPKPTGMSPNHLYQNKHIPLHYIGLFQVNPGLKLEDGQPRNQSRSGFEPPCISDPMGKFF